MFTPSACPVVSGFQFFQFLFSSFIVSCGCLSRGTSQGWEPLTNFPKQVFCCLCGHIFRGQFDSGGALSYQCWCFEITVWWQWPRISHKFFLKTFAPASKKAPQHSFLRTDRTYKTMIIGAVHVPNLTEKWHFPTSNTSNHQAICILSVILLLSSIELYFFPMKSFFFQLSSL